MEGHDRNRLSYSILRERSKAWGSDSDSSDVEISSIKNCCKTTAEDKLILEKKFRNREAEYVLNESNSLRSEGITGELPNELYVGNVWKQVNKGYNNNNNKGKLSKSRHRVSDSSRVSPENKCYTCHPKGTVKNHIISSTDFLSFHHDMWKRSLIIVTPNKHYQHINDFKAEEISDMFLQVSKFCEDWNLRDYQICFNSGKWQTHSHFHLKIKINDKIANRMRRDHFQKIKLEQNYTNVPSR